MGGRATRSAIALKVFVTDGSLEFFSGHGLADIAPNRPVTEDTVFRIASITKTFTRRQVHLGDGRVEELGSGTHTFEWPVRGEPVCPRYGQA